MRRFVDLHTHSTASDGKISPSELVRLADANRLAAVALTDHDTAAGLPAAREAAKECPNLCFIAGIEVSADPPSGTLHILGLGIDENAPSLTRLAKFLRDARSRRNPKIVAKLQAMGVEITMSDVLASEDAGEAGGQADTERVIGRMHIAQALRRKGIVADHAEAFEKYLARGAGAYVERDRLSPRETIAAIHGAGGAAVLAHPAQLQCRNRAHLETILRSLIAVGLDGIEVYHSDNSPANTRLYLDLARRFDLAITGGSDFHGSAKPGVQLGQPRVPLSVVAAHPSLARLLRDSL